jgi:predicted ATPase
MSHGESFLEVLSSRFTGPGLYLLDEPESALSFTGCRALVATLARIAKSETAQAIVATHSPIVAATPGAQILEASDHGLNPTHRAGTRARRSLEGVPRRSPSLPASPHRMSIGICLHILRQ